MTEKLNREDLIRGIALEAATAQRKLVSLSGQMTAEAESLAHEVSRDPMALITPNLSSSLFAEVTAAAATYNAHLATLGYLLGSDAARLLPGLLASPWRAPIE